MVGSMFTDWKGHRGNFEELEMFYMLTYCFMVCIYVKID